MEFLDFETPVKDIIDQINKCKSIENESDVDITKTTTYFRRNLLKLKKYLFQSYFMAKSPVVKTSKQTLCS